MFKIALFPILILLCLFTSLHSAKAQIETDQKIIGILDSIRTNLPQEKAYLHFDKPYYTLGDRIWFKLYLLKADNHTPEAQSKVVYAEMLNERKEIVLRYILPIEKGVAKGEIFLEDTLVPGNYTIRAYSNWMRNFDDSFFFSRTFYLASPRETYLSRNANFEMSKSDEGIIIQSKLSFVNDQEQQLKNLPCTYSILNDSVTILKDAVSSIGEDGNMLVKHVFPLDYKAKNTSLVVKFNLNGKETVQTLQMPVISLLPDIQFFPEGGDLLTNISQVVAFKSINSLGKGVAVSGAIYDDQGKEITRISTQHAGMGKFMLKAETGRSYLAKLKTSEGINLECVLPKAMDNQSTLAINALPKEEVWVYILSNKSINPESPEKLYLIAHSRGRTCFSDKILIQKSATTLFKVPKKILPEGIIHFTLFNERAEPISERLVFVKHPENDMKIALEEDKAHYVPREKITLRIKALDASGVAIPNANFSMSVTDVSFVDTLRKEANLKSYFLLQSDLKGFIENPNYYFEPFNANRDMALDLLMLTQGWSRFVWKQVLGGGMSFLEHPIDLGLSISGKIKGAGLKGIQNNRMAMLIPSLNSKIYETKTDEKGYFTFDGFTVYDTLTAVIQAYKKNNELAPVDITLIQDAIASINPATLPPSEDQQNYWDYVSNNIKRNKIDDAFDLDDDVIQLEGVEVRSQRIDTKIFGTSVIKLQGNSADKVFEAEEIGKEVFALNVLRRVAGVQVSVGPSGRPEGLNIRGLISIEGSSQPLILLDGIPVDVSAVNGISTNDIASIEVLKSAGNTALYGSRGAGGVILVYTKTYTESGGGLNRKGLVDIVIQGYYKAKEFYAPRYDVMEKEETIKPDVRTTLYWNPSITTNAQGEATIDFFASDSETNYQVILEGITASGLLGRQTKTIKVGKK